jgi:glycosyltransferase involved in cell wall biosynthesis
MENDVEIVLVNLFMCSDIQKCLENINSYTCAENSIVCNVLTDSKSKEALDNYLKNPTFKNVHIRVQEYHGCIAEGINHILAASEKDIVLIDSDCIVSKEWLVHLKHAAYESEYICSVSPLTNSGSFYTVSGWKGDEDIDESFAFLLADMVRNKSLKLNPYIPLAQYFCTYIKRNVINRIGLLDTSYESLFGSMADFSFRAAEAGFSHVLCDSEFIYRTRNEAVEDKELTDKDIPVMKNKFKNIYDFDQEMHYNYELEKIYGHFKHWSQFINNKKNILYVIHSDFKESVNDNIGGTQFHLEDIVKNNSEYNCLVLSYDKRCYILTCYLENKEYEYVFYFGDIKTNLIISNKHYKKIIVSILNAFNISLVHVQHMQNHSLDVIYEAKKAGIPVVLTLHDYYYICPTVFLLNKQNIWCYKKATPKMCGDCLHKRLQTGSNIIDIWQEEMRKALMQCDVLIAPTQTVKDMYDEYYGIGDRITIIEHGVRYAKSDYTPVWNADHFNVAFIGSLAYHKGSDLIYKIITNGSPNINWHIFGIIDEQRFLEIDLDNIFIHGRYERHEIIDLLKINKINLACILSLCSESYCYTLNEAIAANLPVVITDIGALGERGRKYGCCKLVNPDASYEDVLKEITAIAGDRKMYEGLCERAQEISFKTEEDMTGEYIKLYRQICRRSPDNWGDCDMDFIDQSFVQTEFQRKMIFSAQNILGLACRQTNQIIAMQKENKEKDELISALYEAIGDWEKEAASLSNTLTEIRESNSYKFIQRITRIKDRLKSHSTE